MPLTVHHLQVSQSERLVWLCEEIGIPYELRLYQRAPIFSPQEYLDLHPIGAAPVITDDGGIKIAESGACVEYILNMYGKGKLAIKPGEKGYADYLYWLHFSNGTLQPGFSSALTIAGTGVGEDHPARKRNKERLERYLNFLDARLKETGAWLAGEQLTATDIMMVFTLTTMRKFNQMDLSKYENIVAYLQRVAELETYRKAMQKGDPEMDVRDAVRGPPPELFGPFKKMREQAQAKAKA